MAVVLEQVPEELPAIEVLLEEEVVVTVWVAEELSLLNGLKDTCTCMLAKRCTRYVCVYVHVL